MLTINELKGREREIYGEAVLEVVSNANNSRIEIWKEEAEMCATLERIMAPEIAERERLAREDGIEEGREEGRILAYAELGVSIEDIAKQFSLSKEEIEKILSDK